MVHHEFPPAEDGGDQQLVHIEEVMRTLDVAGTSGFSGHPPMSASPAELSGQPYDDEYELLPPRNLAVEQLLRETIDARGGKITFAEFTEICLYSEHGFYSSGIVDIGFDRDFITPSELHPAFGYTVAAELHTLWRSMGSPARFDIVEGAAGRGVLAKNMLAKMAEAYPQLYAAANFIILERSPALIQQQQCLLQGLPIHWIEGSIVDTPIEDVKGVIYTVEGADALRMHRLIRRDGTVKEKYVTYDENGEFYEIEDVPSPEVDDPFYTDRVPEGVEVTASPDMDRWQEATARALDKGYALTFDYATRDVAEHADTYVPRVYSRHLRDNQGRGQISAPVTYSYKRPGSLDITASVDFKHLLAMGERYGLQPVYNQSQTDFLTVHNFTSEVEAVRKQAWRESGGQHSAAIDRLDVGATLLRLNKDFRVALQCKGFSS
jgi:SAM-dependent MidA family methyltransferase